MILVKKKHLYILVTLVCVMLVFGELRFFMALRSVDLVADLQVKYEVESFIFASIVLTIIVYLFLVFFMRQSDNVLKRMDKMIELSEYGKHDIAGHLGKLDRLGEKIGYLTYNFRDFSKKQALKISSLAGITDVLVRNNEAPVLIFNRHGNIIACSGRLLDVLQVPEEDLLKTNYNEIVLSPPYNQLFYELEGVKERSGTEKMVMRAGGRDLEEDAVFYPVTNSDGVLSHIVGVLVNK